MVRRATLAILPKPDGVLSHQCHQGGFAWAEFASVRRSLLNRCFLRNRMHCDAGTDYIRFLMMKGGMSAQILVWLDVHQGIQMQVVSGEAAAIT